MHEDRDPADRDVQLLETLLHSSGTAPEDPLDDAYLVESIRTAPAGEKAFAQKAAASATLLREWCDELQGWSWDDSLEAFHVQRELCLRHRPRSSDSEHRLPTTPMKTEFSGSSDPALATYFESRLSRIQNSVAALDLRTQKQHVLQTHLHHKSRAAIQQSAESVESVDSVDSTNRTSQPFSPFTALVTITILRSLPYYSHLTALTETWLARVTVLRLLPQYFNELAEAHHAIDNAWSSIGVQLDTFHHLEQGRTPKVAYHYGMFRERYESIREEVKGTVAWVGQKFDTMLDALEGSAASLPQEWVTDVESLEAEYAKWEVEARKKVLVYEMRLDGSGGVLEENNVKTVKAQVESEGAKAMNVPGAWIEESVEQMDRQGTTQVPARPTNPIANVFDDQATRPKSIDALSRPSADAGATSQTDIVREHIRRHVPQPQPRTSSRSKSLDVLRTGASSQAAQPQSNHADIVRQHIRRPASRPGLRASSRPRTPARSSAHSQSTSCDENDKSKPAPQGPEVYSDLSPLPLFSPKTARSSNTHPTSPERPPNDAPATSAVRQPQTSATSPTPPISPISPISPTTPTSATSSRAASRSYSYSSIPPADGPPNRPLPPIPSRPSTSRRPSQETTASRKSTPPPLPRKPDISSFPTSAAHSLRPSLTLVSLAFSTIARTL